MVYQENFNNQNENKEIEEKLTLYDLRQIYTKIVGEHLMYILYYKRKQNFYLWFKALEDLLVTTKFKFKKDYDDDKIERLKKEVISLANQNSETWTGESSDQDAAFLIDKKLRELEDCIYTNMQEGGIWGKGYEYDPDEI